MHQPEEPGFCSRSQYTPRKSEGSDGKPARTMPGVRVVSGTEESWRPGRSEGPCRGGRCLWGASGPHPGTRPSARSPATPRPPTPLGLHRLVGPLRPQFPGASELAGPARCGGGVEGEAPALPLNCRVTRPRTARLPEPARSVPADRPRPLVPATSSTRLATFRRPSRPAVTALDSARLAVRFQRARVPRRPPAARAPRLAGLRRRPRWEGMIHRRGSPRSAEIDGRGAQGGERDPVVERYASGKRAASNSVTAIRSTTCTAPPLRRLSGSTDLSAPYARSSRALRSSLGRQGAEGVSRGKRQRSPLTVELQGLEPPVCPGLPAPVRPTVPGPWCRPPRLRDLPRSGARPGSPRPPATPASPPGSNVPAFLGGLRRRGPPRSSRWGWGVVPGGRGRVHRRGSPRSAEIDSRGAPGGDKAPVVEGDGSGSERLRTRDPPRAPLPRPSDATRAPPTCRPSTFAVPGRSGARWAGKVRRGCRGGSASAPA